MRKGSSVEKWLAAMAVALLFVTGCALFSRRVKAGEEFTLRPGEEVVIATRGTRRENERRAQS